MPSDPADLLALTEQELDLQLGDALYADDFGAKDPTDADKRRRATTWFAAQKASLQQAVCSQPVVQRYVQKEDAIERELFDAVLSAIASMAGVPVPVGVLAAKIVRYGVSNLCQWDPDAPAASARDGG